MDCVLTAVNTEGDQAAPARTSNTEQNYTRYPLSN